MNISENSFKSIILCLVFAVLTAALAQLEISLPLVPISGQTLAVGLTATILGSRLGVLSMILYVIAGAAGAPVFTGFDSGIQVLTGPTGGYIFGFILAAWVIGYILEKGAFNVKMAVVANVIGMVVILICGVIQLKYVLALPWTAAFETGVYPFIITGLLKAFLAGGIGIYIRKKLTEKNVIFNIGECIRH